ncbi:hypothetical protein GP486_002037 [Trichoglossum hirsutum]|uniref:Uncharacterized protein n=1 Tax=Trichoglossum hirsutum TaxID=265104 RepID=A0A9P8RS26_9PEZI|nr:hypothetical protein GP486_002037 [Trichoglossum hirsutum]
MDPPFTSSSDIAASSTPAAAGTADNTLDMEASAGHSREESFEIPGERIFAIYFRRAHFRWFKSKDVDAAYLDRDTVWAATAVRRGDGDTGTKFIEVGLCDGQGTLNNAFAIDETRQEEYYIPGDEDSHGGLDDDSDEDNE